MVQPNETSSSLFFEAIARKIEADPDLLHVPLENIERWVASGHTAVHRLREWQELILRAINSAEPEGLAELLRLLRSHDEESLLLKGFSRF